MATSSLVARSPSASSCTTFFSSSIIRDNMATSSLVARSPSASSCTTSFSSSIFRDNMTTSSLSAISLSIFFFKSEISKFTLSRNFLYDLLSSFMPCSSLRTSLVGKSDSDKLPTASSKAVETPSAWNASLACFTYWSKIALVILELVEWQREFLKRRN